MTSIDSFSLCTVPLELLANGTSMGSATGFVWKLGEQNYLITNWHVVTGRNAQTGKLELPARPDAFKALFNSRVGEFGKTECDIKIRDEDGKPRWLVHPNGGRIDVAVLPLPLPGVSASINLCPINAYTSKPLRIRIGMEVFILGYPFGSGPPAYPVWKRGTIASEPDLVRMTTGYYLVDTASRPGMSGSPVILQSWTNDFVEGSMRAFTDTPATNLVGIYSGRLAAGTDEAQIGIVWHESYIEEIVAGNVRGDDFR